MSYVVLSFIHVHMCAQDLLELELLFDYMLVESLDILHHNVDNVGNYNLPHI